MIQEKTLSIPDLARELDLGIATTKFILKRFSKRFPFENRGGDPYYSKKTIPLLIQIKEGLDSGLLPSEIDQELQNPIQPDSIQAMEDHFQRVPFEPPAIGMENEGFSLIRSFFTEFKEVQQQMAFSLKSIATALEEMNKNLARNSTTRATPPGTDQALDEDEPDPLPLDPEDDLDEIIHMPDPSFDLLETSEIQMDDLNALIEEEPPPGKTMEEIRVDDIQDMDDLSLLVDRPQPDDPQADEMPRAEDSGKDLGDMDNLSALLDPMPEQIPLAADPDLDDLSLLVEEMDDLSLLVEEMDDLSTLIDQTPSLKPDITPEQDLAGYKAAVMKTILQLKTEGLTTGETTQQLNEHGVQTISGKPQWSEKAILQIYKFIDSAS